MIPTFAEQRVSWSYPPVDDIGYLSSEELLKLPERELGDYINAATRARFKGWRNYEGRWRSVLKMDETEDCDVLDYGCGIGIEALQYARHNRVYLADIVESNIDLAIRVLRISGYRPVETFIIQGRSPFCLAPASFFDVIHCSGVLHHIPRPVPVVRKMATWLKPGGELRLMLYSDVAWRLTTGTLPPAVAEDHDSFLTFVRSMDGVGGYADWYNRERLEERFGEWFEVEACEYLTEDQIYLGAVLRRR